MSFSHLCRRPMSLVEILAFAQVIGIDIALSGDNAVVIGTAASGLADGQRKRAILIGTLCAIILRIVFSIGAVFLLGVPYLNLIGGLMLVWVCWKMWGEITSGGGETNLTPKKTLFQAVMQIAIADVSMSLDNVLAVAGAAQDHMYIMAFGLILSIGLMACAANYISKLLNKYPSLQYVGLALIMYVATSMILRGLNI